MSKSHRLFVGNLPPNIVDQELKNEFASYGSIKSVEVKHKRNPEDEITNTFAFISIEIDGHSLKQCLQEFKNEKYKGRFLNVTVARENFLDKLKREREEAAGSAQVKPAAEVPSFPEPLRALPVMKVKQSVESSSESEDSSSEDEKPVPKPRVLPQRTFVVQDEPDEDGNIMLRKRSKAYLENGKIKIDAHTNAGAAPIHIIERNKKEAVRHLTDDKAKEADKKRMESLGKMKDTYNQQKLAIKNALASVDGAKSNKIVFDAPEPMAKRPIATQSVTKPQPKGKALFDDDDDEEEQQDYSKDFAVKEQYEGAKGARLLRLQSSFKNDKRFDMDANFLEEGYEQDEAEHTNETAEVVEEDDERKWQYGILESVMGKKIQNDQTAGGDKWSKQQMLRYDPTKKDHTKYLAQAQTKRKAVVDVESNPKRSKVQSEPADEVEVSKEQFYKVSSKLTASLQRQEAGEFSLLSMFGSVVPETPAKTKKAEYHETLLATKAQKAIEDMTNPFNYESSDGEEQVQQKVPQHSVVAAKAARPQHPNNPKASGKKGTAVWHETFFFFGMDDERLKEGATFFKPTEHPNDNDEIAVENQQKEMRNIIKKKIKRSIKSALPHGAKPNKRFRKFVRNL